MQEFVGQTAREMDKSKSAAPQLLKSDAGTLNYCGWGTMKFQGVDEAGNFRWEDARGRKLLTLRVPEAGSSIKVLNS